MQFQEKDIPLHSETKNIGNMEIFLVHIKGSTYGECTRQTLPCKTIEAARRTLKSFRDRFLSTAEETYDIGAEDVTTCIDRDTKDEFVWNYKYGSEDYWIEERNVIE